MSIIKHRWFKKMRIFSLQVSMADTMSSGSGSDYSNDDTRGHVNSLFEHDGDTELKASLLLRFGGKGKEAGEFEDATSIMHLGKGRLLVTDMINNRLTSFSKFGEPDGIYISEHMEEPWTTEMAPNGRMYVTSRRNKCVLIFSSGGEMLDSFGQDFFHRPCGVAITNSLKIVVSDIFARTVSIHDSTGRLISYVGDSDMFACPRYVTVSPCGEIIVSDSGHHCLKVFDEGGNFIRKIGKYGKADGNLKCPYGVTTDNYGNIIVADHYNDRVSLFNRNGQFVRHLLTLNDVIVHPQGVALSSDMKLFVTHGNLKAYQVSVFKLSSEEL